jgi:hypothetical protein
LSKAFQNLVNHLNALRISRNSKNVWRLSVQIIRLTRLVPVPLARNHSEHGREIHVTSRGTPWFSVNFPWLHVFKFRLTRLVPVPSARNHWEHRREIHATSRGTPWLHVFKYRIPFSVWRTLRSGLVPLRSKHIWIPMPSHTICQVMTNL